MAAAAARAAGSGLVLSRPVTFVTGNAKKLEEVRAILGQSIPFQSLKLDLPELQGEPEDISKEKARLAAKEVNGPVLVEDTCLCFNALKGLPGPYIRLVMKVLTICCWDMRTNQHMQCVYFLLHLDQTLSQLLLREKLRYAEMPKEEKNKISHRSRALAQVRSHFAETGYTFQTDLSI
ncbi:inosine triphosphate pyrophosphatase isoform X4 [Diospyros lotus]|uniref:inosine triphosphate pyrophosphatase isoform X4 n=1 Tax=Diospyros lotus TaxID=55363 RepID=UPI0022549C3F|nr:inosine triphosphate pyrophosphatase isoform X4 [Diospyros lotus]